MGPSASNADGSWSAACAAVPTTEEAEAGHVRLWLVDVGFPVPPLRPTESSLWGNYSLAKELVSSENGPAKHETNTLIQS